MAVELLGSLQSSGAGTGGIIMTTLLWLIIGLALGGILYLVWVFMQYKYKVRIKKPNGRIEYDKAREVKDRNDKSITRHVLKKHRGKWEGPFDEEYVRYAKTLFGQSMEVDLVLLPDGTLAQYKYEPTKDEYSDELQYTISTSISPANKKWAELALKENIERYTDNNWWEKYGNTVMNMALIAMVLVTMVVIVRELGVVTEQLGNVASALKSINYPTGGQVISNSTGIIT